MKSKKSAQKAVPEPPKLEETPFIPKNRRPWYIALLAVGTVVLAVSTLLAITGAVFDWERRVFDLINHAYLPVWVSEQVAKPISNAVWGMVFLVVALLAVPKFRLLSWQYAVAAGSAYVTVFIIEHLVDRARPIGLESYEVVSRAAQDGPGFPSGHVAVIAALGLAIWPFVSWPWRIFIIALIGAEAWSRVFLGVHAPLDVVGGIAVAMVVVATIHLVPSKIRTFFKLST